MLSGAFCHINCLPLPQRGLDFDLLELELGFPGAPPCSGEDPWLVTMVGLVALGVSIEGEERTTSTGDESLMMIGLETPILEMGD